MKRGLRSTLLPSVVSIWNELPEKATEDDSNMTSQRHIFPSTNHFKLTVNKILMTIYFHHSQTPKPNNDVKY